MVKFTVEQLRALMDKKHNIRNMSVIAHVDHGKSTLTEALVSSNEIVGVTDSRKDEQSRGITIKSTGVSLHYTLPESIALPQGAEGREFLVNLIDSPGHVDFSSEVTAALRLTDGALVLVDCVEGSRVQTETVLQQALKERIKPVLIVNKIDRAFLELQLSPEEMYQAFSKSISDVNRIIEKNQDAVIGDCRVYPERGTVAFCAGKQGWAFTLRDFARVYARKFKVNEDKMVQRLWGDHFFDPQTKKWTDMPLNSEGKKIPRGFCHFILDPIAKIFASCMKNDIETLTSLLAKLDITLKNDELQLKEKELLGTVMKRWLPASASVLEMVACHLPSPAVAQRYRVELLYTGPMDDVTAKAIRECDPNGPLVMFISKLFPANKDRTRFHAYGRVFSGTITPSSKVIIMGANHTFGGKEDIFTFKPIQRTSIVMGRKAEAVTSVPCGNTCAVGGIDQYLSKSGTLTTDVTSHPIVNMRYKVSPVVRVNVEPKNPADLPKLTEALKLLSKGDPLVVCSFESTGEHIIACAGQLHLDICINDLKEYMKGAEIKVSEPMVAFKETVTSHSAAALAKSPNHHNRLYATCGPLPEGLPEDIEGGVINATDPLVERARKLVEKYSWDVTEARKIWSFGPHPRGANILIDGTKGIQYMNEIKDSVVAGFQWVTYDGVLCGEPLRGVKFVITDAHLHADTIHRGPGQIIPASKSVFYGSQLLSNPRLLEPVFEVFVNCPSQHQSGVFNVLSQRRGQVVEVLETGIKAHLPVLESFGLTEALRGATAGNAFPSMSFSHWQLMPDDPLNSSNTQMKELITKVRKRKGLQLDIPSVDRFLDKL